MEIIQDAGVPALSGVYLGLRFSSSVPLTNVYARAMVGGVGYSLDATEAPSHFIGDLGGANKTSYWFVNHPTIGNGTFQVQIYVGDPAAGGVLQGTSTSYTISSANADNSAATNKIVGVSVVPSSIQLGQSFNAMVCYGVNSTARLLLQPAASASFDPNNLRLGNVAVETFGSSDCTGVPTATLANQLLFASITSNSVRATYTFQAVGTTPVTMSPIVSARSGIYKYNTDFNAPAAGVSYSIPGAINQVTMSKSVSVASNATGNLTVTYTVTASNAGLSAVTLDEIVDTLPTTPGAVTYVANSTRVNGVAQTAFNPVVSAATLTWSSTGAVGTTFAVPAGGIMSLSFDATIPAATGVYTNRAVAKINGIQIDTTASTGDNAPATATTRIGQAVLNVSKSTTTPTVVNTATGTSATYTISVINNGGSAAAGVALTDVLPAGFSLASWGAPVLAGGATRTATTDPSAGATSPTWGSFSLPAGASVSITFTAQVAAVVPDGVVSNNANVSSTTSPITLNHFNGAASSTDDVLITSATLSVTKTTSTPLVTNAGAGASASYTITVSNAGTATATGVRVTDALPAGFSHSSTTIVTVNGSLTSAYVVTGTTVVQWDTNPTQGFAIQPGQTLQIVFAAAVAPGVVAGTYNNSASASGLARSIAPFDGAASSTDDVVVVISVAPTLAKSFNPGRVTVGAVSTLSLVVSNPHVVALTALALTDTFPAGLQVAAVPNVANGCGGTFTAAAGATSVALVDGTLAALQSCTITVTVVGIVAGELANTASGVSSAENSTAGPVSNTAVLTVDPASGGVVVGGWVYDDANHNLRRDASEPGTGLALHAKLVSATSPTGPALQAAVVDGATGAYQFSGVAPGEYRVVIDDNALLGDVLPNVTGTWTGTEASELVRSNVVVASADLGGLNFGLFNGNVASGRVFRDHGGGGGTPNNAVQDGSEPGLGGVTVRLTDASGGTTLDSTTTDASGQYRLYIPASSNGATLRIVETNPTGLRSVGGAPAASYDRASDAHSVPFFVGTNVGGLNFADVPVESLVSNQQRSAAPGDAVFFTHRWVAGTGGSVAFSVSGSAAWPHTLLLDANCNGVIDTGEGTVPAAVSVTQAQAVCLIVKVTVPGGTAIGTQNISYLQATFTHSNSIPALVTVLSNEDLTTVGAATGLSLVKSQDNATPLPGTRIVYTLSFTNLGTAALSGLRINDITPAHTRFVSAACGAPLASGITACSVGISPAVGATGNIEWVLVGPLAAGASGYVTFAVDVQ